MMRIGEGKASPLPVPKNISGSIPAYSMGGRVLFAGVQLDKQGKVVSAPDIYAYDFSTQMTERLTNTPWEEWRPAPSPNGRYVYYIANPEGQFDIFRLDIQSRRVELAFATDEAEWDPDVSPDGRWLVFASRRAGNWDLYLIPINEPGRVIQLTSEPSDDWDPRFLPVSNAVVFASSVENQAPYTYYLCPFGERDE